MSEEISLRKLGFCLVVTFGLCLAVWSGATPGAEPPDDAFQVWLAGLREEALSRDVSVETLDLALSQVELLSRVIELDRNQPEFTMTFAQYRDRIISEKRVRTGRDLLWKHRALLAELRSEYGVQPRFIVALWGIESNFGERTGSFSVIDALSTLAYDGRRGKFFRGELLDALTILDEGHIDRDRMNGSWSGAMGQPQFIPSSFRRFAVDHDGDSRRDIWASVPDVLASAANYLAKSGWRGDRIWGREVRLPDGFDPALSGRKVRRSLAEWQALGVRRSDGSDLPRADVEGSILQLSSAGGPVYLVYENFGTLLKWNRSEYFAATVGLLSDRISGR
jgi:membrane-bound lytic murein transglycosylase B